MWSQETTKLPLFCWKSPSHLVVKVTILPGCVLKKLRAGRFASGLPGRFAEASNLGGLNKSYCEFVVDVMVETCWNMLKHVETIIQRFLQPLLLSKMWVTSLPLRLEMKILVGSGRSIDFYWQCTPQKVQRQTFGSTIQMWFTSVETESRFLTIRLTRAVSDFAVRKLQSEPDGNPHGAVFSSKNSTGEDSRFR